MDATNLSVKQDHVINVVKSPGNAVSMEGSPQMQGFPQLRWQSPGVSI